MSKNKAEDRFDSLVGSVLDYPSAYMGGASHVNLKRARKVRESLVLDGWLIISPETKQELVSSVAAQCGVMDDMIRWLKSLNVTYPDERKKIDELIVEALARKSSLNDIIVSSFPNPITP